VGLSLEVPVRTGPEHRVFADVLRIDGVFAHSTV
jgi:hypothetical protein